MTEATAGCPVRLPAVPQFGVRTPRRNDPEPASGHDGAVRPLVAANVAESPVRQAPAVTLSADRVIGPSRARARSS